MAAWARSTAGRGNGDMPNLQRVERRYGLVVILGATVEGRAPKVEMRIARRQFCRRPWFFRARLANIVLLPTKSRVVDVILADGPERILV
jgi:hypothetical protein